MFLAHLCEPLTSRAPTTRGGGHNTVERIAPTQLWLRRWWALHLDRSGAAANMENRSSCEKAEFDFVSIPSRFYPDSDSIHSRFRTESKRDRNRIERARNCKIKRNLRNRMKCIGTEREEMEWMGNGKLGREREPLCRAALHWGRITPGLSFLQSSSPFVGQPFRLLYGRVPNIVFQI